MSLLKSWQNYSVTKKLYTVVGVMALLIATELFTLYFAMTSLSAVRGYVGGCGLWSQAQKMSVYALQKYSVTRNEKDFDSFMQQMAVPKGDHDARVAMESQVIRPARDCTRIPAR